MLDTSQILIPRSMSSEFTNIRTEFGITFNAIRNIIKNNPPPLDDLKEFLEDCYSPLKPSLDNAKTISDVLTVVRDKCTLIDINYLDAVVKRFDFKAASTHLECYKKTIEHFCQSVSLRLCLEEAFSATKTPPTLKCETVIFVLDWDPDDFTLNDIRTLLSAVFERLAKRVTIKIIKEGNSIVVTCTFSLALTGIIIAVALKTVESAKIKGLISLTIGCCVIWKQRERDNVRNNDVIIY